jgi:hypothetical protein
MKPTRETQGTLSDPLRAALRQERRLLLVICLLFGALVVSLYANARQAERIERLAEERTLDHEAISHLEERLGIHE